MMKGNALSLQYVWGVIIEIRVSKCINFFFLNAFLAKYEFQKFDPLVLLCESDLRISTCLCHDVWLQTSGSWLGLCSKTPFNSMPIFTPPPLPTDSWRGEFLWPLALYREVSSGVPYFPVFSGSLPGVYPVVTLLGAQFHSWITCHLQHWHSLDLQSEARW